MYIDEVILKLMAGGFWIYFDDPTKLDLLNKILRKTFPASPSTRGATNVYFGSNNHGDNWSTTVSFPYGHNYIPISKITEKKVNQKIIGYKLKESVKEFEKAAAIITYGDSSYSKIVGTVFIGSKQLERINNANVLDLWFEPVYEEEKPKYPNINGYDGKSDIDMGEIVYGCARLRVSMLTVLDNMTTTKGGNRKTRSVELDSGVVITMDQIKQMLKAYKYEPHTKVS
jgi:hypothetical protein